jgi:hypothetical protein
MMNFDPSAYDKDIEINFDPDFLADPTITILNCVAEQSIIQAILAGRCAEEDETPEGLRFIRHLLSLSRSANCGFIPNFGNMETIRLMARQYIRTSGGPAEALKSMYHIMEEQVA